MISIFLFKNVKRNEFRTFCSACAMMNASNGCIVCFLYQSQTLQPPCCSFSDVFYWYTVNILWFFTVLYTMWSRVFHWHLDNNQQADLHILYIYKDNYGRLNMIGRERSTRALIGCDSQSNATRWLALASCLTLSQRHLKCSARSIKQGTTCTITMAQTVNISVCVSWNVSFHFWHNFAT